MHRFDHRPTYHCLIFPLSFPADLKMLIHIGGVSHEATLCSFGHFLDHRVCGRWEQKPVHAVEAGGNTPNDTQDRYQGQT